MRQIQAYSQPDLATIQKARALEEVCIARDGLPYSLSFDPSLNFSKNLPSLFLSYDDGILTGAMTFFAPTHDEAEVTAITHPNYRKTGVFRALAAKAANAAIEFGIPDLLFFCDQRSSAGVAAISKIGAVYEYSEYTMRFDLKTQLSQQKIPDGLRLIRATNAELNAMARISAESFQEPEERARHFLAQAVASENRIQYLATIQDTPAGICGVGYDGKEATIFGLGVLPSLQNKGIGRGMILLLLTMLIENGTHDILIEVDSTNAAAFHLYLSCGFQAEATIGYYRKCASELLTI